MSGFIGRRGAGCNAPPCSISSLLFGEGNKRRNAGARNFRLLLWRRDRIGSWHDAVPNEICSPRIAKSRVAGMPLNVILNGCKMELRFLGVNSRNIRKCFWGDWMIGRVNQKPLLQFWKACHDWLIARLGELSLICPTYCRRSSYLTIQ